MSGLIDTLRHLGEDASARAREAIAEPKLRRDVERAYAELGQLTFALVEQGLLTDERIVSRSQAIRTLERRITEARLPPGAEP